ncbi:MAG: hypothetical protein CMP91_07295 [Gammaproteobacteria bacterium]|nr:hypothetical protein [Gammaproteobacteria bacterium]MAY03098.1 hypothetical protein [Gammaproteobacteria bacterium]|tara:strand:- start:222 stop:716 length:495 start_codon:yes stop_codon:yes gene_type:complete
MTEQDVHRELDDIDTDERDLWPSPGQKLKNLREELGYSREKVSEALFITVHYVTALENDEFQKLPGHTFTKGYFKSYAEFLGADIDEVLSCYQNLINADKPSSEEAEREKNRSRKSLLLWIVAAVILIAVLIALVLGMTSEASAKQIIMVKQLPDIELRQRSNS